MTLAAEYKSVDHRYRVAIIAAITCLILVRLACAASFPLAYDEALYWRWSQHLSTGYLDHPPMNPILIRIGTSFFGSTEFGIRVFGVLLAAAASWAIWRAAEILFNNPRVGPTAALFFNLTLPVAVGSVLATPDSPVLVTTCFLLFFLAKIDATADGRWWLAAGVAFGLGMFSKYSTLFFAPSILIWIALVPRLRTWLLRPWPYLGGLVALLIFSPVLLWNAQHGWASVIYQANRLAVHEWSLRYVGEVFATQLGLATPPIFLLGCFGLFGLLTDRGQPISARVLLNAMVWPIVIYFLWHAFHGRVEGNWPEPIFPAFAIAAAVATDHLIWGKKAAPVVHWSTRLAVPTGLLCAGVIYLQAIFGIIPLGRADPTARQIGAGWPALGAEIDHIRQANGAGLVLAGNYGLASWLAFYLPSRPPVEQINGRIRWVDAPLPDSGLFNAPMLYVCSRCETEAELSRRFKLVAHLATLPRQRRDIIIEEYSLYRVVGPRKPVLDSL